MFTTALRRVIFNGIYRIVPVEWACVRNTSGHLRVAGSWRSEPPSIGRIEGELAPREPCRGSGSSSGWGALGFPGLILDAAGAAVDVQVFESSDLPDHWARLDDFEGPGYRRVVTQVRTAEGDVSACIYVLA